MVCSVMNETLFNPSFGGLLYRHSNTSTRINAYFCGLYLRKRCYHSHENILFAVFSAYYSVGLLMCVLNLVLRLTLLKSDLFTEQSVPDGN